MLRMLRYALPMTLCLGLQSAHAQPVGSFWESNVTLTQADLDMITGDLAKQIHGKQLGVTASWNNPASGNSGTVKLLKILTREGRRCEEIEYRISPPEKAMPSDRYVLTSCMQPDGSWKLS